jgi:hypothetical protein
MAWHSSRIKSPGPRAVAEQDKSFKGFGKSERQALSAPAQGTRASANTSGPDFTCVEIAVKLRILRSAPNEENLFLLPDRFSKSELFETTIQPFDLMSRRHPLSSTRAIRFKICSEKQIVLKALDDVPASNRRQFY